MNDRPGPETVRAFIEGPFRVGVERRWRVRLADGRPALLAQLLPELGRDEALRRRYVHDTERLRALDVPVVLETLALGPAPDPRDPGAPAPWRLRLDPDGVTLESLLAQRGPLPIDEALALGRDLADAIQAVHGRGAILRDLHPRNILLPARARPAAASDVPRLRFTDVGLGRVDMLSTRTAASLVLEGSPYVAPEQLRKGLVDVRADLYSWAVLLWRMLTGTLPFGDGPAILAESRSLPPVHQLRPEIPSWIAPLLDRCLARDPGRRPRSAREISEWLGGREVEGLPPPPSPIRCQACLSLLRPGLRLCLSCGRAAVQFSPLQSDGEEAFAVDLLKAQDTEAFLRQLRDFLEVVSEGPVPPLNFLTGDARWSSEEERNRHFKVPARLLTGASQAAAEELAARLRAQGMEVQARSPARLARRRQRATVGFWSSIGLSVVAGALTVGNPAIAAVIVLGAGASIAMGIERYRARTPPAGPLVELRRAPVALPAADTLVARLGALLPGAAPDVTDVVAEVAVLVQRLVDRRAEGLADAGTVDLAIRPVGALVEQVGKTVESLTALDVELARLDEGTLVRALAASEARGEPRQRREELLFGLDRLRILEDERARHLSRLLEAAGLLERAVGLALTAPAGEGGHDQEVRLALASLQQDGLVGYK